MSTNYMLEEEREGKLWLTLKKYKKSEENNLGWYMQNSLEILLHGVKITGLTENENTYIKAEFKWTWENHAWTIDSFYVIFLPEITGTDKTW